MLSPPAVGALPQKPDFSIAGVEWNSPLAVGRQLISASEARSLSLGKQPEAVVLKSLRNVTTTNHSFSIVLKINELNFQEQWVGTEVAGQYALQVSFAAIRQTDTLHLTQTSVKSSFRRSAKALSPDAYEQLIASSLRKTLVYFQQWAAVNRDSHEAFAAASVINILPARRGEVADTVFYSSERPLQWTDFQGKPFRPKNFGASIFSSMAYDLQISLKNGVLKAEVTPRVYMVRGMSWVLPGQQSERALRHEQLHFMVAQVAMNRYLKRLRAAPAMPTVADLQSFIQYEYLEAYREMNRLQDAYDTETAHGSDPAAQARWDSQIEKWLAEN